LYLIRLGAIFVVLNHENDCYQKTAKATQLENTIYLNANLTDNRTKVAHKNELKVGQVIGLIGISFSLETSKRLLSENRQSHST
jgi:hypothetical protein